MKDMWNAFLQDESGQGLVEYVLIIALVAIGLITVMGLFRDEIGATFDVIITSLQGAPSGEYTSTAGTTTGG